MPPPAKQKCGSPFRGFSWVQPLPQLLPVPIMPEVQLIFYSKESVHNVVKGDDKTGSQPAQ